MKMSRVDEDCASATAKRRTARLSVRASEKERQKKAYLITCALITPNKPDS